MSESGDNGDGAMQEVEILEAKVEVAQREKTPVVLDRCLNKLLLKIEEILDQDDLPQDELVTLGKLVARMAPMAMPRLSAIHQVTEDVSAWVKQLKGQLSLEETDKALAQINRKIEVASRGGRPKTITQKKDPHDD